MKLKLCILIVIIILFYIFYNFYNRKNYKHYIHKLYNSGKIKHYKTEEKIPKIIHQTWKTEKLPENFKEWSNIIKRQHPDWEYILWTDKDNRKFIQEHYNWFLDIYDNYDVNIKRVDAVRYFILYHYGGVYIDMDFICLKPIDTIIDTNQCVFGYQSRDENKGDSIANAFMACPKNHHFFELLINMLQYFRNNYVLDATGPTFLTNIVKNYPHLKEIFVYKMPLIYTHEWNEDGCKNYLDCIKKYPNSYMSTFWTGTWIKK
jgi:mannosyltransferase OCH1-like enzyme